MLKAAVLSNPQTSCATKGNWASLVLKGFKGQLCFVKTSASNSNVNVNEQRVTINKNTTKNE